MKPERFDIAISGAGIIGLSTAYQILKKHPSKSILLIEKEGSIGRHQSGHNSGVIHSGIYYPPGSLKAKNCLRGYELLLEFCKAKNVKHEICGKVIVATRESELEGLEKIRQRGEANGLKGLQYLNQEQLKEKEPHVRAVKALWVPQTGIVDYPEMMVSLKEEIETSGGRFLFNSPVKRIQGKGEAEISAGEEKIRADLFINCSGLYSDKVCREAGIKTDVKIVPFRGEYYKIKKERQHLVKNLIYPVPDPNFPFLGVHFTRMINGGIEAGPNAVLAYAREGYKKSDINLGEFMETLAWPGFQKVAKKYWKTGLGEFWRSYSKSAFTKALQELIPEIKQEDLVPGGSGVRAQACDRTGGLLDDFNIQRTENSIHVLNAPSPAATSSLSIGEHIANLI